MKLKNIQQINNTEEIQEKISEYYDNEVNSTEAIYLEARFAMSEILRKYYYKEIYENFKISNSVNLTKIRTADNSKNMVNLIFRQYKYKNAILFFYFYSVLLKNINKIFSCRLLNFNRNNSK